MSVFGRGTLDALFAVCLCKREGKEGEWGILCLTVLRLLL